MPGRQPRPRPSATPRDDEGLQPASRDVTGPEVCFRMWNADDPEMWEKHGWVPYGAVQEASGMFKRRDKFDPQRAYDLDLALTLLRESKLKPS